MNSERLLEIFLSDILSGNEQEGRAEWGGAAMYIAKSNLNVSLDCEQVVNVVLENNLVEDMQKVPTLPCNGAGFQVCSFSIYLMVKCIIYSVSCSNEAKGRKVY